MHPGPGMHCLQKSPQLSVVHFRGTNHKTKRRVLLTNYKPKSRWTLNSFTEPGRRANFVEKIQENKVHLLNGIYEKVNYRILDPSGKLVTT